MQKVGAALLVDWGLYWMTSANQAEKNLQTSAYLFASKFGVLFLRMFELTIIWIW